MKVKTTDKTKIESKELKSSYFSLLTMDLQWKKLFFGSFTIYCLIKLVSFSFVSFCSSQILLQFYYYFFLKNTEINNISQYNGFIATIFKRIKYFRYFIRKDTLTMPNIFKPLSRCLISSAFSLGYHIQIFKIKEENKKWASILHVIFYNLTVLGILTYLLPHNPDLVHCLQPLMLVVGYITYSSNILTRKYYPEEEDLELQKHSRYGLYLSIMGTLLRIYVLGQLKKQQIFYHLTLILFCIICDSINVQANLIFNFCLFFIRLLLKMNGFNANLIPLLDFILYINGVFALSYFNSVLVLVVNKINYESFTDRELFIVVIFYYFYNILTELFKLVFSQEIVKEFLKIFILIAKYPLAYNEIAPILRKGLLVNISAVLIISMITGLVSAELDLNFYPTAMDLIQTIKPQDITPDSREKHLSRMRDRPYWILFSSLINQIVTHSNFKITFLESIISWIVLKINFVLKLTVIRLITNTSLSSVANHILPVVYYLIKVLTYSLTIEIFIFLNLALMVFFTNFFKENLKPKFNFNFLKS